MNIIKTELYTLNRRVIWYANHILNCFYPQYFWHQMCAVLSLTPTNAPVLWTPTQWPIIQFNSYTNYLELAWPHKLRIQSHITAPPDFICKSQIASSTSDQPAINSVRFYNSLLRFNHLLKWLIELKKTVYLLPLVYYKGWEWIANRKVFRIRCRRVSKQEFLSQWSWGTPVSSTILI